MGRFNFLNLVSKHVCALAGKLLGFTQVLQLCLQRRPLVIPRTILSQKGVMVRKAVKQLKVVLHAQQREMLRLAMNIR